MQILNILNRRVNIPPDDQSSPLGQTSPLGAN
jgi:hypothetical protein